MKPPKKTIRKVIKADPGWCVGRLIEAGKDGAVSWNYHLTVDPIIAWDIEHCEDEQLVSRSVMPITIGGMMHHEKDFGVMWVIKRPDGWFEMADGAWERVEDVIEELMERQGIQKSARAQA